MPISRSNKPLILLTIGDPSGVGPEVTLKALASRRISRLADFLVIGDKFVIDKVKKDLKLRVNIPLLDLSNVAPEKFSYGKSAAWFGKASMEYLDKALELLGAGKADALVTAPVNKGSINSFLLNTQYSILNTFFKGHTEYLAEKTNTKDYAMMFVGRNFNVVLVTRHIAIKNVPKAITASGVYKTIMLTHSWLKKFFGIPNPKIGVCGLNPHAGEKGLFGDEERVSIIPAIRRASKTVKAVCGPIPADIIFHEALQGKYDAIVAMYHDQGLSPFKMLYFSNGVNVTLGLPFIRTSPDHGTAFNIAGKGIADPSSMVEAIKLACRLALKKIRCSRRPN